MDISKVSFQRDDLVGTELADLSIKKIYFTVRDNMFFVIGIKCKYFGRSSNVKISSLGKCILNADPRLLLVITKNSDNNIYTPLLAYVRQSYNGASDNTVEFYHNKNSVSCVYVEYNESSKKKLDYLIDDVILFTSDYVNKFQGYPFIVDYSDYIMQGMYTPFQEEVKNYLDSMVESKQDEADCNDNNRDGDLDEKEYNGEIKTDISEDSRNYVQNDEHKGIGAVTEGEVFNKEGDGIGKMVEPVSATKTNNDLEVVLSENLDTGDDIKVNSNEDGENDLENFISQDSFNISPTSNEEIREEDLFEVIRDRSNGESINEYSTETIKQQEVQQPRGYTENAEQNDSFEKKEQEYEETSKQEEVEENQNDEKSNLEDNFEQSSVASNEDQFNQDTMLDELSYFGVNSEKSYNDGDNSKTNLFPKKSGKSLVETVNDLNNSDIQENNNFTLSFFVGKFNEIKELIENKLSNLSSSANAVDTDNILDKVYKNTSNLFDKNVKEVDDLVLNSTKTITQNILNGLNENHIKTETSISSITSSISTFTNSMSDVSETLSNIEESIKSNTDLSDISKKIENIQTLLENGIREIKDELSVFEGKLSNKSDTVDVSDSDIQEVVTDVVNTHINDNLNAIEDRLNENISSLEHKINNHIDIQLGKLIIELKNTIVGNNSLTPPQKVDNESQSINITDKIKNESVDDVKDDKREVFDTDDFISRLKSMVNYVQNVEEETNILNSDPFKDINIKNVDKTNTNLIGNGNENSIEQNPINNNIISSDLKNNDNTIIEKNNGNLLSDAVEAMCDTDNNEVDLAIIKTSEIVNKLDETESKKLSNEFSDEVEDNTNTVLFSGDMSVNKDNELVEEDESDLFTQFNTRIDISKGSIVANIENEEQTDDSQNKMSLF